MHASNQSKPEVLIFVLIRANCLQMRQFMTKLIEPCHEKTGFLHMQKQRRRSASR